MGDVVELSGGGVPPEGANGDVLRWRDFPPEGATIPIPTPSGLRWYRVAKASTFRLQLEPLDAKAIAVLTAGLEAGEWAQRFTQWALATSVCAAHLRVRRWPRRGLDYAQAIAEAQLWPLPRVRGGRWTRWRVAVRRRRRWLWFDVERVALRVGARVGGQIRRTAVGRGS